MNVVQNNGDLERFNPNKIINKIESLSVGLSKIDTDSLSQLIISRVIDGITTKQINALSAELATSKMSISYEYSQLAARLLIDNLYKETAKSFYDGICQLTDVGIISKEFKNKVEGFDVNRIEAYIAENKERDFNFNYLGVNTLIKSYLLKIGDRIVETPQQMYMRVAIFLSDTEDEALSLYNQFSNHLISPASPILFNAGTEKSTLISCNLVTALSSEGYFGEEKDPDSLEGIHELYKQASKLSAGSAGLGIDATSIRSKRNIISTSGGHSAGVHKMILKPMNELMRGFNQAGKRNGAAAIYIEPWHLDILDFLKIKMRNVSSEVACKDLFSAMWIPDLFMEKVQERVVNGKSDKTEWTLFCPKSLFDNGYDLHNVYGKEFVEQYEKASKDDSVLKEVVDINEVWGAILASQMESGIPYIAYKDRVNESNMQSNIGVIKQSNLCVAPETLLLTSNSYIPIEELKDQRVTVWNGFEWSDTIVRQTGTNQELFKVTLDDGNEIYTTDYHRWSVKNGYNKSNLEIKRTIDLEVGDKLSRCEFPLVKEGEEIWKGKTAYTHGFFCSDGFYRDGNPHIYLYDEKKNLLPYIEVRNKFTGSLVNRELDELAISEDGKKITVGIDFNIQPKYYVPTNHGYKERLNWFEGVCDGDGCITRNGDSFGLQLCSINLDYLREIGLMLNTLGISSTISLMKEEGLTVLPDGKGNNKEYLTKTAYRLLISHYYLTKLKNIGFAPKRLCLKNMSNCTNNRSRLTKVIAVDRENRYDNTYCLTEPKRNSMVVNGIMTLNCNEIVQYTDHETVANCVLSAAPVGNSKYIDFDNKSIKWDLLKQSVRSMVKYLNKVCDINKYPTPQAKKGGLEQRSIAIGIMGLADLFAQLDMEYDSIEARNLSTLISEHIYYYALEMSCELAEKENKTYPLFEGSDYEKGLFHFDKYGLNGYELTLDWETLREKIKEHGLLNSLLIGLMPTASCQVVSTEVQTSKGVKSFAEILEQGGIDWQKVETTNTQKWLTLKNKIEVLTLNGLVETDQIYYNGHHEVYSIEMEDGTVYEATGNHKFLVNRNGSEEWIRVEELIESDDIVNINEF